jgi:hypothetical protein
MRNNPHFDLFTSPDERNQLRTVVRDMCEKEIAPHAADVAQRDALSCSVRASASWPHSLVN